MKVINLYGGPGTGKSRHASAVFYWLKGLGYNCELITEYAKKKVWEGNTKALECQPYVTSKQLYSMYIVKDQVDFLITDSPLLQGMLYEGFGSSESFKRCIVEWYCEFDNIDVFLTRNTSKYKYNPKGRTQTEDGATGMDPDVKELLVNYSDEFYLIDAGLEYTDFIDRMEAILNEVGWDE